MQRLELTLQSILSPHKIQTIKVSYIRQATAVALHGAHIVNDCSDELQSALEELDPNVVKAALADIGDFREMEKVHVRDEYSISTFTETGLPSQAATPPPKSMEMHESTVEVAVWMGHGTSEQETFPGNCMARASSSMVASCQEAFQEHSSQHPVLNPDVLRCDYSMQMWTAEPVKSLSKGLNFASQTYDCKRAHT